MRLYGIISIEYLVRRLCAEVTIAKITNARNNIEFFINLRIKGGRNNFHLQYKNYEFVLSVIH